MTFFLHLKFYPGSAQWKMLVGTLMINVIDKYKRGRGRIGIAFPSICYQEFRKKPLASYEF